MSSDAELLAAWRGGNRAAGERLFDLHGRALLRFFRNKVDADIDDLIQQTFLGCLEGSARFEGRGSFRAFLLGIARNVLFNHFRAMRARVSDRDLDFERDAVADLSQGPSSVLVHRSEEQVLLQALRALPLEKQILLELYYWEAMTGAEIAEALGEPEGTIRTRIRAARRMLAERVDEFCRGDQALRESATDLEHWAEVIRASSPGLGRP